MKRVFAITFFLFFIVAQLSPLYAATTAPTPLPSGTSDIINGLPIPGINCGVAGDPDPGKTKCCAPPKQDRSLLTTITDFAGGLPIVGPLVKPYTDKVDSINSLQNNIDPCEGDNVVASTKDPTDKTCICIQDTATASAALGLSNFCKEYFPPATDKNTEILKCSNCMNTGGFYTALGCIPLDVSTFITSYILKTGIGIAGGVALLCILYSAFRMQTSMGNAEAIKKAQENLTACITGLIIIIFSVLILKIIGVDILRIPGFG